MHTLPDDYNEPNRHAFCVLPWLHRFVNLGGEIQVCCTAEEHEHSFIRDDSGRPVNVADGLGEEEIGAMRHLREIRQAMLAGKWPAACERCRVTEQAGGSSRRCDENRHFEHHIPWILANTDAEGRAPANIRTRDYRLGNLCNLRCRMCHPGASRLLLDEWNQVTRRSVRITGDEARRLENMDWFQNERMWTEFRDNLGDLEHLHFAGGEPLVIPEVLAALEICVEAGMAGRIELTFNTNLTKIPDRHRELWPRFRSVNLVCSVDAFGTLNDYIRYPSKWPRIAANLDMVDREHEALNLGWAVISATVQVYNIFHLDQLIDYTRGRFSFIRPMPNLLHLSVPQWFNIQYLPDDLKREASGRLGALRARLESEGFTEGLNQLGGIIRYMDMAEHAPQFMEEFRRVTGGFDRLRGESLASLVPELAPLMNPPGMRHRLGLAAGRVRRLVGRFLP